MYRADTCSLNTVKSSSQTSRRRNPSNIQERLRALESNASERVAIRAKIVLLWSKGDGATDIAKELGVTRQTASKWISRFKERGVLGLEDEQRPGRPELYDEECVNELLKVARTSPKRLGLNYKRWSIRKLEQYLNEERGYTIKRSRIFQLLKDEDLAWAKPSKKRETKKVAPSV